MQIRSFCLFHNFDDFPKNKKEKNNYVNFLRPKMYNLRRQKSTNNAEQSFFDLEKQKSKRRPNVSNFVTGNNKPIKTRLPVVQYKIGNQELSSNLAPQMARKLIKNLVTYEKVNEIYNKDSQWNINWDEVVLFFVAVFQHCHFENDLDILSKKRTDMRIKTYERTKYFALDFFKSFWRFLGFFEARMNEISKPAKYTSFFKKEKKVFGGLVLSIESKAASHFVEYFVDVEEFNEITADLLTVPGDDIPETCTSGIFAPNGFGPRYLIEVMTKTNDNFKISDWIKYAYTLKEFSNLKDLEAKNEKKGLKIPQGLSDKILEAWKEVKKLEKYYSIF